MYRTFSVTETLFHLPSNQMLWTMHRVIVMYDHAPRFDNLLDIDELYLIFLNIWVLLLFAKYENLLINY